MAFPSLPRLLPLAAAALAVAVVPGDETAEPPQRFVLALGDHEFEVTAGDPFELTVGDQILQGRLRPVPQRTLDLEELKFEYPAGLVFEYEAGEGTETWTLNGRDATLMLYRFQAGGPASDLLDLFVQGVVEGFPDAEVLHARSTLELDGRVHEGVRLAWEFGGFDHVQETYVLDPAGPARRALVLQDTREFEVGPSAEWSALYSILQRSYDWEAE